VKLLSAILFCFALSVLSTKAQSPSPKYIHYYENPTGSYQTLPADSSGWSQLQRMYRKTQMQGYFHSALDTMRADSIWKVTLKKGPRILPDSITWVIPNKVQTIFDDLQMTNQRELNDWSKLEQYIEGALIIGENNGYPFVSVRPLSLLKTSDSTTTVQLALEPGPAIFYDSLLVQSAQSVPVKYIERYLGIRKGATYNESELQGLNLRLAEIPFLQSIRAPEVRFWQQNADIKVFVKRRGANYFNAILGIRPDDRTGKVQITGDVEVRLLNAINRGEELEFTWRKMQTQTQDLWIQAEVPYWFGSPVGTETSLKIYKRDSTFTDVKGRYGLLFQLERLNRISVFIDQQRITNLSAFTNSNANFASSRMVLYGAKGRWSNLDYKLNPREGYEIELEASSGRRNVSYQDEAAAAQSFAIFRYRWAISGYIPTWKAQTIKLGGLGQGILSPSLESAELLRFGGLRTMRGIDEESINATQYLVGTVEYRWLFDRNSALYAFVDQGWYERQSADVRASDWPRAFGVGVNLETKSGIFTFNYSLGQQQGNPIQIRSAKISFGFRNTF
jgi:outer membrane translocation and assembly module TamA